MKKLSILSLMLSASLAWGQQAGQLDVHNFVNPDGYYLHSVSGMMNNQGKSIFQLSNGYVVTVGYANTMGGYTGGQIAIRKENGDSVATYTELTQNVDYSKGAAQFDSMSVVIGTYRSGAGASSNGNSIVVKRFFPDGSIDNSFTNPFVWTFGVYENAGAIAIQSDDKILISELLSGYIYRLHPNGAIDSTFGTSGKAYVAPNLYTVSEIIPLADGKILLAGAYGSDAKVIRLMSNGALDNAFGNLGGGVSTIPDISGYNFANVSISLVADGYILSGNAQSVSGPSDSYLHLVGIDTSGNVNDQTYNLYSGNYAEEWTDCVVQANGKIVVIGFLLGDPTILRFNSITAFDSSFANNGVGSFNIGDTAMHTAVPYVASLQDNGRLLVSGKYQDVIGGGTSVGFSARVLLSTLAVGVINPAVALNETLLYPNPVSSSSVQLQYELASPAQMRISILSLDGRQIAELLNEPQAAASYNTSLQLPESLSNGQYFLLLQADNSNTTLKFTVAK